MQLTPNPAVDYVQLNIQDGWNGAVKVDIVTVTGAVVRTLQIEKSTSDWSYRLDVKDLPVGTYIAKARVGNSLYLGKLVKH
ncbi:MAG: T9SS type A sorting domain-containing protein [Lewinellaceae bacterium]|nr:T9SS type A sorting domain-containing protein [Lewinellaceae bacterium]